MSKHKPDPQDVVRPRSISLPLRVDDALVDKTQEMGYKFVSTYLTSLLKREFGMQ